MEINKNRFNIAVPERVPYMESIIKSKIPDSSILSKFARITAASYQDINELQY